ncbi:MAG: hypothetical protein J6B29_03375 [Clostridia bacterium]|nr:hypothetical protein [Clostridia bacterium]
MKKLMCTALVLAISFALSLFGCNSQENVQQEKTSAEKLCAQLSENGYVKSSDFDGEEALGNYLNNLNMGGAIIPVEMVEKIYTEVDEYYFFEKGEKTVVFAEMSASGIKLLLRDDSPSTLEKAEELGQIYGNCVMLTGNEDSDRIIKELIANEDEK